MKFSISWTRSWAWLLKNRRFWRLKDKTGRTLLLHRQDSQIRNITKLLMNRMGSRPQATTNSHSPDLSPLSLRMLRHLSIRSKTYNFATRSSLSLPREPSIKRTNSSKASPGIRLGTIFTALSLPKWVLTNRNFWTNMRTRAQAPQIWPQTKRIKRRGRSQ